MRDFGSALADLEVLEPVASDRPRFLTPDASFGLDLRGGQGAGLILLVAGFRSTDEAIAAILSSIREVMNPPEPKHRPIGFTADIEEKP
jgi:hypothetical protein